jgi:hypothetical protein
MPSAFSLSLTPVPASLARMAPSTISIPSPTQPSLRSLCQTVLAPHSPKKQLRILTLSVPTNQRRMRIASLVLKLHKRISSRKKTPHLDGRRLFGRQNKELTWNLGHSSQASSSGWGHHQAQRPILRSWRHTGTKPRNVRSGCRFQHCPSLSRRIERHEDLTAASSHSDRSRSYPSASVPAPELKGQQKTPIFRSFFCCAILDIF